MDSPNDREDSPAPADAERRSWLQLGVVSVCAIFVVWMGFGAIIPFLPSS